MSLKKTSSYLGDVFLTDNIPVFLEILYSFHDFNARTLAVLVGLDDENFSFFTSLAII